MVVTVTFIFLCLNMDIFLSLLLKLLALYVLILLGYIAAKGNLITKESISKLLIYLIVPCVIGISILDTTLTFELLIIPLLFFCIATVLGSFSYYFSRRFFSEKKAQILGFTGGTGNTGYFGIPIALILFGADYLPIVVFCGLGCIVYENTVGLYFLGKSKKKFMQTCRDIMKIPSVFVLIFASGISFFHLPFHPFFEIIFPLLKGTYTVLGMMLIGMGVAMIRRSQVDWLFCCFAFLIKFLFWPILVILFIIFDRYFLHYFMSPHYSLFILMASVPLASNTVAFAVEFDAHPETASFSVFLSTLCALVAIPFWLWFIRFFA